MSLVCNKPAIEGSKPQAVPKYCLDGISARVLTSLSVSEFFVTVAKVYETVTALKCFSRLLSHRSPWTDAQQEPQPNGS